VSDPRQIVHDPEGWNSGPPPALLAEGFTTPTPLFFTRSHAPVPRVDPDGWRLKVHGLVERSLELGLLQLGRDFARHEVSATLACAGLRRSELLSVRPIPNELLWGPEALSTGTWAGISLGEVLRAARPQPGAAWVEFIGGDEVTRGDQRFGFGGSIPFSKALSQEVLLAFELNGAPLPPEHGYPLRAVVPGYFGARSVKWLTEIVLRPEPSANYFQTRAYRVQPEPDPADPRDVSAGSALGELLLNSAILSPGPDERVASGGVTARGWAIGPAGTAVSRVEVSFDGGESWRGAELLGAPVPWCWRLWQARADLRPGTHTLVVRAFDQSGRGQPPGLETVWNVKGYANNAWHRVPIRVGEG
jgi:sulfite oxidase